MSTQAGGSKQVARSLGWLGCVLLCACHIAHAFAASPEDVEKAIGVARTRLYALQQSGNWETAQLPDSDKDVSAVEGGQWGGVTALATYALLESGGNWQSSKLKPAIEWLKKADIKGVYALGMRMQVWNYLPKNEARALIDHDARLMLLALHGKGDGTGFFDYLVTPSSRYDHSVSQYGVWGLQVAAESQQAFEWPKQFWGRIEAAWLRDQDPSGGWGYMRGTRAAQPLTLSMTAAGVSSLFITQRYVHGGEDLSRQGNVHHAGIEAGLAWMSAHFSDASTDTSTWFGIQRVGAASGRKYFGTHDWYREGGDILIREQGAWVSPGGRAAATSFGLLFLVRGRAPVILNKFEYELTVQAGAPQQEAHWNQRPQDASNVAAWIGFELCREDLHWQIVNAAMPAEAWHDAPILYIAGDQAMDLKKADEDRLREYVEQGGLIVCNADGGDAAFTDSILTNAPGKPGLAARLFPDYTARVLPADHPIYTQQMFRAEWKEPIELQAVGNGSREFMLIFTSGDPALQWQARRVTTHAGAHQLMADVYLHAVDRSNAYLRRGPFIAENPAVQANRALKVARIQYQGNWNPEPGGWRRMAALLHNQDKLDLQIQPVELGSGKLSGYQVAHLTGNLTFQFSEKERAGLRAFSKGGGLLVVDSCGGSSEFAASAVTELAAVLGPEASQIGKAMPPGDSLFTNPNIDISYRRATRRLLGNNDAPQLRAIVRAGRPVCYYSPQDLSVGMVGQDVGGIRGYSPDTATAIMRNILLKAAEAFSTAVTP